MATYLSNLGRREEALSRAEEAVAIRRELARSRPEAFTPDLAMSLNNLATRLSELGRREEAVTRADEAVRTLAPVFLSLPAAFAPWMATMISVYLKACEAAEIAPDADLVGPLVEQIRSAI